MKLPNFRTSDQEVLNRLLEKCGDFIENHVLIGILKVSQ